MYSARHAGASGIGKNDRRLSDNDYLTRVLSQLQQIDPRGDDKESEPSLRRGPFENSVQEMATELAKPIKDISPYTQLYLACYKRDIATVEINLQTIEDKHSPDPIQSLACLAAKIGCVSILNLCLERGAVFDESLDSAAEIGASDPVMLDALLAINWRNLQTSQEAKDLLLVLSLRTEDDSMINWLIEHGADLNKEAALSVAISSKPAWRLAKLVETFGGTNFDGSAALQWLTREGDLASVKLLLDAGADVEEVPPSIDIREPGPFTALVEAVKKRHVKTIQLLLDGGASVDRVFNSPWTGSIYPSALVLAKKLGNQEVIGLR